jgi:hypothetical protein
LDEGSAPWVDVTFVLLPAPLSPGSY